MVRNLGTNQGNIGTFTYSVFNLEKCNYKILSWLDSFKKLIAREVGIRMSRVEKKSKIN